MNTSAKLGAFAAAIALAVGAGAALGSVVGPIGSASDPAVDGTAPVHNGHDAPTTTGG